MEKEITKNILVTGAGGFVGRALLKKLLETQNNIFAVSRSRDLSIPGLSVLSGDLEDLDFCKKIVGSIDTVYYLAGYKKNISYHIKNPSDFIFGNVKPLVNFLEAVKNSPVKKIVYLSSTNVGLYKDGEEDGYVVGKYINELILKSFSKQHGTDIKIVRSPGIYGPGDNFEPETANFIPSMIRKVDESTDGISVWGSGKRELQFIYVEDLISNLIEIENTIGDFFIVGNNTSLTINEIVEKIVRLSGKNLEIKNDVSKPDKPTQLFEFKNLVSPEFDFERGIKNSIDYYKTIKK